MLKSLDFTDVFLLSLFPDGIDAKWLRALALGQHYLFDNTLVVHHVDPSTNICQVNSISSTPDSFSKPALRHLKKLIETHEAIVIASSNVGISKHLAKKYGLCYNVDKMFYYKGFSWAV